MHDQDARCTVVCLNLSCCMVHHWAGIFLFPLSGWNDLAIKLGLLLLFIKSSPGSSHLLGAFAGTNWVSLVRSMFEPLWLGFIIKFLTSSIELLVKSGGSLMTSTSFCRVKCWMPYDLRSLYFVPIRMMMGQVLSKIVPNGFMLAAPLSLECLAPCDLNGQSHLMPGCGDIGINTNYAVMRSRPPLAQVDSQDALYNCFVNGAAEVKFKLNLLNVAISNKFTKIASLYLEDRRSCQSIGLGLSTR